LGAVTTLEVVASARKLKPVVKLQPCYYNKKLNGSMNRYGEGMKTVCRDCVVGMLKSRAAGQPKIQSSIADRGENFIFPPRTQHRSGIHLTLQQSAPWTISWEYGGQARYSP
jgi:hypothetical protein